MQMLSSPAYISKVDSRSADSTSRLFVERKGDSRKFMVVFESLFRPKKIDDRWGGKIMSKTVKHPTQRNHGRE